MYLPMVYAICCTLHAVCYLLPMLYAVCCTLYAGNETLSVIYLCLKLYAVHCMNEYAVCCMLYTLYCMLHGVCCILYVWCCTYVVCCMLFALPGYWTSRNVTCSKESIDKLHPVKWATLCHLSTYVVCYMLYTACCMLYVTYVACCML